MNSDNSTLEWSLNSLDSNFLSATEPEEMLNWFNEDIQSWQWMFSQQPLQQVNIDVKTESDTSSTFDTIQTFECKLPPKLDQNALKCDTSTELTPYQKQKSHFENEVKNDSSLMFTSFRFSEDKPKQCADCHTKTTPLWRRGLNQTTVCNRCGLRQKRRIAREKRNNKHCMQNSFF